MRIAIGSDHTGFELKEYVRETLREWGHEQRRLLTVTCDDAVDLPVPGQKYTFGVAKVAQAPGDFQVLAERDRRARREHVGRHILPGLATLHAAMQQALV